MGHQKGSDKQQSFLMAKFRIGEKADRNFDTKKVAREMRKAQGPDDMRSLNSLQPLRRLIEVKESSNFCREGEEERERRKKILWRKN